MNYERLNGKIKAPSHIMRNYRNPQFTLTLKRQCALLKTSDSYTDCIEVKKLQKCAFPISQVLMLRLCVSEDDLISVTNLVIINGTEYRQENFVLLEKSDNGFVFGQIDVILKKKMIRFSWLTYSIQNYLINIHIPMYLNNRILR